MGSGANGDRKRYRKHSSRCDGIGNIPTSHVAACAQGWKCTRRRDMVREGGVHGDGERWNPEGMAYTGG